MVSWALIVITLVASTSGFRFVCYYSNKAQYRGGIGMFKPEYIDPVLCTHLVYLNAQVNDLSIQPSEWNDKTTPWFMGMYDGVWLAKVKNPQLKILLAVGRDNDKTQAFLRAVSNEDARRSFARNVASYIRNIKFDGANLEWSNLASTSTSSVDRHKFVLLVKALQKEFKTDLQKDEKAPLILAATLPAKKVQIDSAYDIIKELSEELDFISIRTLDLRTAADRKVGLSAPLYSSPNAVGNDRYLSVKWVADYYVSLGVERDKMNIGIPTYGRSFQLNRDVHNSIGSAAMDDGHAGPWTGTVGIIGYFELCDNIRVSGRVRNVPDQHGRYYFNDFQWVSYEDIVSVLEKTCYIRKEGFGGITFWTIDLDDFSGESCRQDNFPLITTAVNVMKNTNASLCTKPNPSEFVSVPAAPSNTTTTPIPVNETVAEGRVVCYFTNWGQYRWGRAQYLPENIDPDLCTHIIYLFAQVKGLIIDTFSENDNSEPWREGLFARVVKLKKEHPEVKVLLSIGGATADYAPFEAIVKDAEKRAIFAKYAASFLKERGFDGMELSWYQPTAEFKHTRFALITALRGAFNEEAEVSGNPRLLLTLGMPAGKKRIDEGYGEHLPNLAKYVDFINLLTYNFHGSWDVFSGFNSPLYAHPDATGDNVYYSVDWVANYYASNGVAKEIINIGIPTFAITFTLRESKYHFVGAPVIGTGKAGKYTGRSGILSYYEVCFFIATGADVVNSTYQRVSYAVKGDQWVSFESVESVTDKACYAMTNGFGGVNVWSLDYDDFNGVSCEKGVNPLMKTIYKTVQNKEQGKRCINVKHIYTTGGSDGILLGTTLSNAHLLLKWLLVIVCVV